MSTAGTYGLVETPETLEGVISDPLASVIWSFAALLGGWGVVGLRRHGAASKSERGGQVKISCEAKRCNWKVRVASWKRRRSRGHIYDVSASLS